MNTKRVFWAGVLGGAIMTVITALAQAAGLSVSISMMLGTLFGITPGPGAWILGFIVHLVLSGAIALLYGWGFENGVHRANPGVGAAFSVLHVIVAGLLLGIMPAIHPLMPLTVSAPGMFLSNFGGAGVIAFIVLHLAYGLTVGGLYGSVQHQPRAREAHAGAK